jgi:hypothetical protein
MKTNGCGHDIEQFQFKNLDFSPASTDFFYQLSDNQHDSSSSADYCAEDFASTQISVVLETVFDGPKIHLTEKILRPIACGHPFLLAAGPGSLQYLRSYGFKTFSPWLNEDYDLETNSVKRLEKIIKSMQEFVESNNSQRTTAVEQIKQIAAYNKQWFFSTEFVDRVNSELFSNIEHAMHNVKKTRCKIFRSLSAEKKHSDKQLKQGLRKTIAHYIKQLKNINPI